MLGPAKAKRGLGEEQGGYRVDGGCRVGGVMVRTRMLLRVSEAVSTPCSTSCTCLRAIESVRYVR